MAALRPHRPGARPAAVRPPCPPRRPALVCSLVLPRHPLLLPAPHRHVASKVPAPACFGPLWADLHRCLLPCEDKLGGCLICPICPACTACTVPPLCLQVQQPRLHCCCNCLVQLYCTICAASCSTAGTAAVTSLVLPTLPLLYCSVLPCPVCPAGTAAVTSPMMSWASACWRWCCSRGTCSTCRAARVSEAQAHSGGCNGGGQQGDVLHMPRGVCE